METGKETKSDQNLTCLLLTEETDNKTTAGGTLILRAMSSKYSLIPNFKAPQCSACPFLIIASVREDFSLYGSSSIQQILGRGFRLEEAGESQGHL